MTCRSLRSIAKNAPASRTSLTRRLDAAVWDDEAFLREPSRILHDFAPCEKRARSRLQ